jgi:penicillin-binding protein 1A
MLKFLVFCCKFFVFLGLISISAISYVIYHYSQDLPDYSQLREYHPPCVTRMYSADGKLIEEYAREHRIFVPINSVPKSLIQAFISAEDKNFYEHSGIDIFSIIRAAISNVSNIINQRRVEGGSTITQQVVKNFLLTSERSMDRKIKEALLSYMISKAFTKDQIMELYLNQIYLGKSAHGVAAAALAYFNKSVEELSIAESAVLASLPKAPSKYNPEKDYNRALTRRNYVISRMYDDGYITNQEAQDAIALPIKLVKYDKIQTITADYYAGQVREEVIGMFGEEYFYTAGLTIITCMDSEMQKAAASALIFGIRKYDDKKGYRGPIKKISLVDWKNSIKTTPSPLGIKDYELAVVLKTEPTQATIGLKNGSTSTIKISEMQWARTNVKSTKDILNAGDIIAVLKLQNGYSLKQIPDVNGGIIVIEPQTGRVIASEGGYDFGVSKFDRTTKANRQPGSLFKLFVYLVALENGVQPTDIFEDGPIEVPVGPGLPTWRPKNYKDTFLGPITLRKAIEKSINTVTVRISQKVGLRKIAEAVKRFGINEDPPLRPSMVLGALETTLLRMTTAYAIIANKGRNVIPHYVELIKDRKGNIIYKRDYAECTECKNYRYNAYDEPLPPSLPASEEKIITDEATNYQVTSLMMGGAKRGTSQGSKKIGKILAGKTGTTNNSKDAWFIGFTPRIVVGTYVGFDTPRDMGKRDTGATVALPIFVEFMETGYKDIPSIPFEIPDNIRLESIDYDTGKPSNGPKSIMEAFKINNDQVINQDVLPSDNSSKTENDSDVFSIIRSFDSPDFDEVY